MAKVAAEALLSLYADRHGLDAVSTRIGSFLAEPETSAQPVDLAVPRRRVRMFDAALTTPAPGFAVLYGISHNARGWWDLAPGRALGYDPLDDAEGWADRVESRLEDAMENAHVGGPYLAESMERPALDRT